MTHIDDRLHAAGLAFREQSLPDVDIEWPADRRKTRWMAPLAAAATVVAVVAAVTVAAAISDRPKPPAKSPAKLQQPDRSFAVPPPDILPSTGPLYTAPGPICGEGDVQASARLRATPEGVAGLINLRGAGCNLQLYGFSLRLLDGNGQALSVSSDAAVTGTVQHQSRIANIARVGFAWTGSYCGVRPAGVQIQGSPARVSGGHAMVLRVPLAGPLPPCAGRDTSRLIPGGASVSGAVMPPALAWRSLHARIVLPPQIAQGRVPLVVEISTSGTSDVSLAATCPRWAVTASIHTVYTAKHNAFGWVTGGTGDLCSKRVVVKPGRPVTLRLGDVPTDTQGADWHHGSTFSLEWGMAGVPVARATAIVR